MKSIKFIQFLAITALLLAGCKEETAQQEAGAQEAGGLKDAYKDAFYIGAAINADQINEADPKAAALLLKEFNSITPENHMKWMHIQPGPDSFDFALPDKFVALGEKHGMNIVGHTLVWHSQLAPFVEQIKDAAEMEAALTKHINTIVGRYKGRVNGWDVVNEALNEDGTLRETPFLKTMGEGYLEKAFKLAAAADPEAELYYNDYNIEQPAKRAGCIAMIKKLQAAGVKIDGVGIQGHWSIAGLPYEDIEKSVEEFSALGLKVHFTEVDITMLPNPWDLKGAEVNQNFPGSPYMNPYPDSLPVAKQEEQAVAYQRLFELLLKHRDKVERVTFWGIGDGNSWLNGWPIKDRTNYPLLFDRNFEPKPAYNSVMELKVKP
ncbi:MAG: endo-1,4-beta-xylanase [Saprospiraceae bacterium]|jgi:endo-1,4-beta-xylanase|nr:endo-1,4-beta-xylanase [Saprospiraceae bacterium]